jgi:hypothetical protein
MSWNDGASVGVAAQDRAALPADLQGFWSAGTLTPLQRPPDFAHKAEFTPEEAAEYVRTRAERIRSRLPTDHDRIQQTDIDADAVEEEEMPLAALRTSLIVDPPNGMLPPMVPAADARIAARPKRTFEDPEVFNLAERCFLGNFGLGGSTASPPLIPSAVVAPFFQIVQTDAHVMIVSEWVHDVRVVRMNGTHLPPTVRKWLGDSIGRWEGTTLVVDTTNFRREAPLQTYGASENLHVVERFTRVDANTLTYRVTVEDPDTWERPWTAEWSFRATSKPFYEVACHEGNYAIEHFLRGARAEEQRQRAAARE